MSNENSLLVQGRIVQVFGNLFSGDVAKQFNTQTPKLNKQGQSYKEYGFCLAIPKTLFQNPDPNQVPKIWAAIHRFAYSLYPNGKPPADFKMKYVDGDTGTLKDGTPVNTKKGYPGNLVFTLKTTIPPKFFIVQGGNYLQVNEGIKCGDYVEVSMTIDGHTGANPSLYLNPNMVLLLGAGEEIVNIPNASQVFGTNTPQMPSWAQPATPQGFGPPPTAPAGYPPAPAQMPSPYATPPQAPAMMPAAAPMPPSYPPHHGILPQIHQPQPAAPQVPSPYATQPPQQQAAPMPQFPVPGWPPR